MWCSSCDKYLDFAEGASDNTIRVAALATEELYKEWAAEEKKLRRADECKAYDSLAECEAEERRIRREKAAEAAAIREQEKLEAAKAAALKKE